MKKNYEIYHGDCLEEMLRLTEASVDAVVTDPPYGIAFMGKEWDHGVPGLPFWVETLRVLKPGGHLVAFGGTRMFHRLACATEDAGFEIRDCLSWLYGSGFPKSKKIGDGLGTALKPAWEPIILARKPLVGTVAANVQAHGTGALNVDGCRIEGGDPANLKRLGRSYGDVASETFRQVKHAVVGGSVLGRWPANLCLDEYAAAMLDEQSDSGGKSRFFYIAKASASERHYAGKNTHPTVKPVDLMAWLCRLVTPPGGLILDPFMGSGSTGIAALAEGFRFVGIEIDAEYVAIAQQRIVGSLFAEASAEKQEVMLRGVGK